MGEQLGDPNKMDIILTTLNARYRHTAFGLRYLRANLAELRSRARLLEFECHDLPEEVAESILIYFPRIVAIGVYVWNVDASTRLVRLLKRIQPETIVVLGGPEVSFETTEQTIVQEADYVICGEGEVLFYTLCRNLLSGQRPAEKIQQAVPPTLSQLAFPYDEYLSEDLSHRIVYVEYSRGCPYRCSFCLSSLDQNVRRFSLDLFLKEMQRLLDRGVRQFKFVDRTFNLNVEESRAVLAFFLHQIGNLQDSSDLFLHFEMVPDRLPEPLKEVIQCFPPGMLQFEIGIQSFNPEVQKRIHRRQDITQSVANVRWLLQHTDAHLHTDLIVGLPGEDLESFAAGFDRLVTMGPQEIQVGILKRLRGTPLSLIETIGLTSLEQKDSQVWGMVYNPDPPYDLLCNNLLDFPTLRRLKRFARFWDLFGNSGRFVHVRALLVQQKEPFFAFLALSDWLFSSIGRTHAISLRKQFEWLFRGLTVGLAWDQAVVVAALEQDFLHGALREPPDFLRGTSVELAQKKQKKQGAPERQVRHRQAGGGGISSPSGV